MAQLTADQEAEKPALTRAIEALVETLGRDPVIGIPKGAWSRDVDVGMQFPNAVVVVDGVEIPSRGPGWQKERARVRVFLRHRSARGVPPGTLERQAHRIGAILETDPRLGGGANVERARMAAWKPLVGRGADYVEDAADVTVDLTIYRKV